LLDGLRGIKGGYNLSKKNTTNSERTWKFSFSELKDFIKELGNKKEYEALKVYYFLGH